ncbi:MAG: ABC transporter ATP-binding protein [Aeromicrobium sp.]
MLDVSATAPTDNRSVEVLLDVSALTVEFRTEKGWVRVVDNLSLRLLKGHTLGIVGESGSGKTVTSLAIMGLLDPQVSRLPSGSIMLEGQELIGLRRSQLADLRGEKIAMIFQEPCRSLNPAFTVGDQIAETFRRHRGMSKKAARAASLKMLDTVGIAEAARRYKHYPHEFSGGMCQRVMLAIALACEPKLLIADEPTTALDVTVQSRMLALMNELQHEFDLSILFITHDLGVVAEMCDDVAVMYAGQVVEQAELEDLFFRPQHPYTEGLLAAIPDADRNSPLRSIAGVVPPPWAWPEGCSFHPRCTYCVKGRCDTEPVVLTVPEAGHAVRCVRAGELELLGVEP